VRPETPPARSLNACVARGRPRTSKPVASRRRRCRSRSVPHTTPRPRAHRGRHPAAHKQPTRDRPSHPHNSAPRESCTRHPALCADLYRLRDEHQRARVPGPTSKPLYPGRGLSENQSLGQPERKPDRMSPSWLPIARRRLRSDQTRFAPHSPGPHARAAPSSRGAAEPPHSAHASRLHGRDDEHTANTGARAPERASAPRAPAPNTNIRPRSLCRRRRRWRISSQRSLWASRCRPIAKLTPAPRAYLEPRASGSNRFELSHEPPAWRSVRKLSIYDTHTTYTSIRTCARGDPRNKNPTSPAPTSDASRGTPSDRALSPVARAHLGTSPRHREERAHQRRTHSERHLSAPRTADNPLISPRPHRATAPRANNHQ
jgi:hypothetical protein